MMEVHRTEVMEVGKNKELSKLCHKVKNLYNRANYIYKQHREKQRYLSYYEMDRVMKKEQCYKVLPAHTAQQTLKLLMRNWKAFYRAREEYNKDPSSFLGPPRPPKYKKKEGETVAIFSN
ncbi:MAG: RNA-guided endonuclease TnpB family protein, partial [Candidatus Heimdallarchaeaceae archaeon]